MNIGSAFSYVFEDKDWIKKVGIGGLFVLLSSFVIPIFFAMGYMIQVIKNVKDGQSNPLPEWDMGQTFMKGAVAFSITLVYNIIPFLLILCPSLLIIPLTDGNVDQNSGVAIALNCFMCVGSVIFFIANLMIPAALIRYAETDSFAEAVKFGDVLTFINSNIVDYFIVILVSISAGFLSLFGIILCFIGVYFTNFWAMMVTAHLYGQLARKAEQKMY